MRSRPRQQPDRSRIVGFALVAGALAASPLAAQEMIPLQRSYPGDGPFVCPAPATVPEVTPTDRARAGQLSSDAVQSQILGDLEGTETLLARASELDPASADLAYRRARALEDLERVDEAMTELCRALDLELDEQSRLDAEGRIERLYEAVRERIPVEAREAFVAGLAAADANAYTDAVDAFTVAMDAAPDWGAAVYNRAIMYEYLGMVGESLADYRRYLEVAPTAVDPVVVMVSERIGLLEGAITGGTPSPGGAAALGVALPGMGQYYSGRPVTGTIVLGTVATALATGLMVKDVTVECTYEVPSGGSCAPNAVVAETTDRPLLLPAVGVAATVTVIGAIEALVKARRRRAEAAALAEEILGPPSEPRLSLLPPTVQSDGVRVDVALLRIAFR